MSHSATRRPVLTALQRAAIERELRRSRLDDLPELVDTNLDSVPWLAGVIKQAGSISELRSALDELPEGNQRLDLDLLHAEFQALDRQIASAGIDRQIVVPLAAQIDELRAVADQLQGEQLATATDAAYAAVEALEIEVVDRVSRARAVHLAGIAAAETLRRMRLEVTIEVSGDEVIISGSSAAGQRAEVSVDGDPACFEVSFDDLADAVHPLHPDAGQRCQGSLDLALRFHTLLADAMLEAGLGIGRVEAITAPTRGAATVLQNHRGDAGKGQVAS